MTPSYPDVQPADWFYVYIETAKHYGWLEENPGQNFIPDGIIDRAQMARLLVIAFGFRNEVVEDPEDLAWYDQYIRVLTSKNVLPYGDEEYFSILENVNRTETVDQLYSLMVETGKIWDGSYPEENVYEK